MPPSTDGPPLAIPPEFARRLGESEGAAGAVWVAGLPSLVADLARRWQLVVGSPFALSYNYVAPARRPDGSEVVLKVAFPNDEARRQIAALRLYDARGACALLEADDDRCAMLLERLTPGETLVATARRDDEAATRIGAAVMRALWRPAPEGSTFAPLAAWFGAFDRHRARYAEASPLPAAILELAETLAGELLASTEEEVLLHGDLHHSNILSARRASWLAIDPKGVIGDRGYEVGPFLLNPHHDAITAAPAHLSRRLDVLAEALEYDRERLRRWGIAHAVLSACWSLEDHGSGWESAIATAEALASP